MKLLRIRFGTVLVLALMLTACGGSTSDPKDAGGASGIGGSAAGGNTSSSCDVINATAANVQLCEAAAACTKTQCVPALAQCLGPDYAQGNYASAPCSEYANCVKTCNCISSCSSNCAISSTCQTCLQQQLLPCVAQSSCASVAFACGP